MPLRAVGVVGVVGLGLALQAQVGLDVRHQRVEAHAALGVGQGAAGKWLLEGQHMRIAPHRQGRGGGQAGVGGHRLQTLAGGLGRLAAAVGRRLQRDDQPARHRGIGRRGVGGTGGQQRGRQTQGGGDMKTAHAVL